MTTNRRFQEFLLSSVPAEPILPAVHTTTVTSFGDIIDSGKIEVRNCRFYNEFLIYLFYGKPSYKITNKTDSARRIVGDAAVTFVFDVISLPNIYKSFALDTGASFGSRYDEFLPKGLQIEDFILDGDPKSFGRFVSRFFRTNRDYYLGRVDQSVKPSTLDVVSNAVRDIAASVFSGMLDERACSCEIQINEDIIIKKSKIISIIMPDLLFDEPEVRDILKKWGVRPVLYRFKRAIPSERTEVISEKLGDLYELEGFI